MNDGELDDDDLVKALEHADAELKIAIMLGAYAGLRFGEIVDLRWQDVDLGKKTLLIVAGKTLRWREVPLSSELESQLRDWLNICRSKTMLFPEPRAKERLQCKFSKLRAELGTNGLRPHALRHCFARRMWNQGIDPITLANILGHSYTGQLCRLSPPNFLGVKSIIAGESLAPRNHGWTGAVWMVLWKYFSQSSIWRN